MRTVGLAVLLALVGGAGCQPDPVGPVDLTEAPSEAIEAAVKARKGQVVLIDFWATWCGPCRTRFPHFVNTHAKYADKGLVCMSVCLDKVGGWDKLGYDRAEVQKFLWSKGGAFQNFAATGRNADRLTEQFGLGSSIPYMTLFDKTGARVWDSERHDLDDDELESLIKKELAK